MPIDLGRDLVAADAITPEALADALFHATTRGVPFPRALLDVGAIDEARLDEALDRHGDTPLPHVVPSHELLDALPAGLVERLACVPIGYGTAQDGGLDVRLAVVDPTDTHAEEEVCYHLGVAVTPVRATLGAIEGALARLRAGRASSLPPAARAHTPPPQAIRSPARLEIVDEADQAYALASEPPPATEPKPMFPVTAKAPAPSDPAPGGANFPIMLTKRGAADAGRSDHTPPYPFGLHKLEQLDVLQTRFLAPKAPRLPTLFPEVGEEAFGLEEDPIPLSRPARSKTPAQLPAIPYPDVGALFAAIRVADDRDRVLDLLLAGARTIAKRVGLFVVKRDRIVGWKCSSLFGSEQAFRRIEVQLEDPNLLAQVAHGELYMGPFPATQANAHLLAGLRLSGKDVAVTTIHIEGIASLVLLADDVGEPFLVKHRLEDFSKISGTALARILRARR